MFILKLLKEFVKSYVFEKFYLPFFKYHERYFNFMSWKYT